MDLSRCVLLKNSLRSTGSYMKSRGKISTDVFVDNSTTTHTHTGVNGLVLF